MFLQSYNLVPLQQRKQQQQQQLPPFSQLLFCGGAWFDGKKEERKKKKRKGIARKFTFCGFVGGDGGIRIRSSEEDRIDFCDFVVATQGEFWWLFFFLLPDNPFFPKLGKRKTKEK